jgi:tRNA-specific adenosine deaminase 1
MERVGTRMGCLLSRALLTPGLIKKKFILLRFQLFVVLAPVAHFWFFRGQMATTPDACRDEVTARLGERVAAAAHAAYTRVARQAAPAFPAEWTVLAAVVLQMHGDEQQPTDDSVGPGHGRAVDVGAHADAVCAEQAKTAATTTTTTNTATTTTAATTTFSSTRLRDGGELVVVALGTGCKCLGADAVRADGTVLADSHAEVVCRRSFVAYMHAELRQLAESGKSSLFEFEVPSQGAAGGSGSGAGGGGQDSGGGGAGGVTAGSGGGDGVGISAGERTSLQPRVVLNPRVSLHFYVSQAPCGDACIFDVVVADDCSEEHAAAHAAAATTATDSANSVISPVVSADYVGLAVADTATTDTASASAGVAPGAREGKRRRVEDVHRTGAKPAPAGGSDPLEPGRGYHTRGLLRTKPGRGPPTRSMSCTDKLCRWSVVGCQGALLSRLIPPVYFDSVVIAELADSAALHRALVSRVPRVDDCLPASFFVHLPAIVLVAARFPHGRGAAEVAVAKPGGAAKDPQSGGVSVGWARTARVPGADHLVDVTNRGRKQGVPKKRELSTLALCSKLCKAALWASFDSVWAAILASRHEATTDVKGDDDDDDDDDATYWDAKQQSTEYQMAKAALLTSAPFDGWVGNGQATQRFTRHAVLREAGQSADV